MASSKAPPLVSHVSSAPPARQDGLLVALLALGPLVLVGEWLLVRTHHRPLGAVTFGAIAIVLWTLLELFVRRALGDEGRLSFPPPSGAGSSSGGLGSAGRLLLRRASWVAGGLMSVFVIVRSFF